MNDTDLEQLLRDALVAEARAVVPDDTHRPAWGPTPTPTLLEPPTRRPRRTPSARVWLACGLAGTVAAAMIVAVTVVTGEAQGDRQGPLAPGSGTAPTIAASPATSPTTAGTASVVPPSPAASATGGLDRGDTTVAVPGEGGAAATVGATPTPAGTSGGTPGADVAVYAHCNAAPTDDPPVVRPTTIDLACADNGENLLDLRWTSWSASGATGTGTVQWRTCDPDCASGSTLHTAPTTVTLSEPVVGQDGVPVWTRLELSPDPFPTGGYTLPRGR